MSSRLLATHRSDLLNLTVIDILETQRRFFVQRRQTAQHRSSSYDSRRATTRAIIEVARRVAKEGHGVREEKGTAERGVARRDP